MFSSCGALESFGYFVRYPRSYLVPFVSPTSTIRTYFTLSSISLQYPRHDIDLRNDCFQRGEGVVPRRQVAALLKRANIEFSQALQQTWDELDDPSIGGISFERCVRVSLLIFGNLMIVQMFQNVCIWNQIEFLNICRWNRIIKSTIPRAKRIRTKKYFNLPRLQKEVGVHAQRVYSTYWYIM